MTIIDNYPLRGAPLTGLNMPSGASSSSKLYAKVKTGGVALSSTYVLGDDIIDRYYEGGNYLSRTFTNNDVGNAVKIGSIQGRGTITHIISPALNTSGSIEIKVLADEKLYAFKGDMGSNKYKFWVGGFIKGIAAGITGESNAYGGKQDLGGSADDTLAIGARQAMFEGIGIPFERSCLVTCKIDQNIDTTEAGSKYGEVVYVTR